MHSTADFLTMDLHGPKHVEELLLSSIITTVNFIGFICNSCLSVMPTIKNVLNKLSGS